MSALLDPPEAETCFDELVKDHRPWMLALARRYVRDPGLAEDCVQDALLNAFRSLDRFEGRASMKSWLHRIVVNASLMALRRRRRAESRSLDELGDVDAQDGFDASANGGGDAPSSALARVVAVQTAAIVRAEIDALPSTHREILRRRDLEQLSTAETAEQLSISEGAAKVRLYRARAALRRRLEPLRDQLR